MRILSVFILLLIGIPVCSAQNSKPASLTVKVDSKATYYFVYLKDPEGTVLKSQVEEGTAVFKNLKPGIYRVTVMATLQFAWGKDQITSQNVNFGSSNQTVTIELPKKPLKINLRFREGTPIVWQRAGLPVAILERFDAAKKLETAYQEREQFMTTDKKTVFDGFAFSATEGAYRISLITINPIDQRNAISARKEFSIRKSDLDAGELFVDFGSADKLAKPEPLVGEAALSEPLTK